MRNSYGSMPMSHSIMNMGDDMLQSQAEMLRENIAYVEKELGPDALILTDLRAQLRNLERQERGLNESRPNPVTLNDKER
jgi:hypothetical protein